MVVAREKVHVIVGPYFLFPGSKGVPVKENVTYHVFEPDSQVGWQAELDLPRPLRGSDSGEERFSARTRLLYQQGKLVFHPSHFDGSSLSPGSVDAIHLHDVLNSQSGSMTADVNEWYRRRGVLLLDHQTLLSGCFQALRPGGRVYVSAINTPNLFPPEKLKILAQKAGFTVRFLDRPAPGVVNTVSEIKRVRRSMRLYESMTGPQARRLLDGYLTLLEAPWNQQQDAMTRALMERESQWAKPVGPPYLAVLESPKQKRN